MGVEGLYLDVWRAVFFGAEGEVVAGGSTFARAVADGFCDGEIEADMRMRFVCEGNTFPGSIEYLFFPYDDIANLWRIGSLPAGREQVAYRSFYAKMGFAHKLKEHKDMRHVKRTGALAVPYKIFAFALDERVVVTIQRTSNAPTNHCEIRVSRKKVERRRRHS